MYRFKAVARALTTGRTGRALGLAAAVTLTAMTSACSSFMVCTDYAQQCRLDLGVRGDVPVVSPILKNSYLGYTKYSKDGSSSTQIPFDAYRQHNFDVLGIPYNPDFGGSLPPFTTQYVNIHYQATCPSDADPILFTQNGHRGLTCVKKDGSDYVLPKVTVPASRDALYTKGVLSFSKICEYGSQRVWSKTDLDSGQILRNGGMLCFFLPPANTVKGWKGTANSPTGPQ